MVSTPHPTLSYSSISSIQSRAASLPQSEPEIARETADVKAKRLRAATQPSHIATKNSLQKHWTKRSWSLTSLNSLNESSSYRQAKGAWYYWWLKFRTSWNCSHYENKVLHISVALSKPPCQWSRSRHLLKGFSNKLHKVLVLHCFAPQKSRKPFFATKKKPPKTSSMWKVVFGMVRNGATAAPSFFQLHEHKQARSEKKRWRRAQSLMIFFLKAVHITENRSQFPSRKPQYFGKFITGQRLKHCQFRCFCLCGTRNESQMKGSLYSVYRIKTTTKGLTIFSFETWDFLFLILRDMPTKPFAENNCLARSLLKPIGFQFRPTVFSRHDTGTRLKIKSNQRLLLAWRSSRFTEKPQSQNRRLPTWAPFNTNITASHTVEINADFFQAIPPRATCKKRSVQRSIQKICFSTVIWDDC